MSIGPSCCMCYLFFSTGPCREERNNKLDGLGFWNTGFTSYLRGCSKSVCFCHSAIIYRDGVLFIFVSFCHSTIIYRVLISIKKCSKSVCFCHSAIIVVVISNNYSCILRKRKRLGRISLRNILPVCIISSCHYMNTNLSIGHHILQNQYFLSGQN